jgi:hypothetical protein
MELENSLPLVQAVEQVIGRRPSVFTCRRWVKKGCLGIRLEARFFQGKYFTTLESVRSFIEQTSELRLESQVSKKIEVPKPPVPGRVARAVEAFEQMGKT